MAVVKGAHNGFETGLATGTTITTANSDDGDEHHAFSAVTVVGGGAGATYENAPVPYQGALYGHFHVTGVGDEANVSFDYVAREWWWRAYFYWDTNPVDDHQLVTVHDDAANVLCAVYVQADDNELRVIDSTGEDMGSMTTGIAFDTWWRLEGHVVHDPAQGIMQLKVFDDPTSDTPLVELGGFFVDTGGGSELNRVSWGISEAGTGVFNVHVDAIAWSDEGWIGQDPIEHVPTSTSFLGTTQ